MKTEEPRKNPKMPKKKPTDSYLKRRELEQLSPEAWREKILALPKKIRASVARIIWWDFFSQRLVKNRWHHLDDLLAGPDATGEEIRMGLETCGFNVKMSHTRVSSPE
jgi:hypothetical protein